LADASPISFNKSVNRIILINTDQFDKGALIVGFRCVIYFFADSRVKFDVIASTNFSIISLALGFDSILSNKVNML